jgi:hypothetical protein
MLTTVDGVPVKGLQDGAISIRIGWSLAPMWYTSQWKIGSADDFASHTPSILSRSFDCLGGQ